MNALTLLFLIFSPNADALDLRPNFNSPSEKANLLSDEKTVSTKETIVEINGSKYREIEYKNEKFYVRFLNKEVTLQDETVCLRPEDSSSNAMPEPYRVVGQVEISKRTEIFIQGLRLRCQKVENANDFTAGISHRGANGIVTGLKVNPSNQSVDLSSKSRNDGLEKKIIVNPLTGGTSAGLSW